jgi:hypothetical protein
MAQEPTTKKKSEIYEYQESDRDIWNGGHSAVGGEKFVRD